MTIKKLLRHTIALLIIISVLSCTQGKQKEEESEVNIATLRGPSAISMIKMMEDSLRIGNKDLIFQVKNEPMQIRPLLFREKVDFAVVPTNMAAILYNKNVPYQVAAIPVWGTLYLFGEDTTIRKWEDMKGKKIHLMAKGMTPDVMFRYLLKENGIDPAKDVELDYSFPTHIELANAIASGKAKLGVISEPLVSMVMNKNPNVSALYSLDEQWEKTTGLEIPQTSLLVRRSFAEKQPAFMDNFLSEYRNSVNWVNKNPQEAAQFIINHKILNDKTVAAQSIPRCNLNFKTAGEAKHIIKAYLEIFYSMNPDIIGGKIPDENFYYEK